MDIRVYAINTECLHTESDELDLNLMFMSLRTFRFKKVTKLSEHSAE